jgi:hypothetical protein
MWLEVWVPAFAERDVPNGNSSIVQGVIYHEHTGHVLVKVEDVEIKLVVIKNI